MGGTVGVVTIFFGAVIIGVVLLVFKGATKHKDADGDDDSSKLL